MNIVISVILFSILLLSACNPAAQQETSTSNSSQADSIPLPDSVSVKMVYVTAGGDKYHTADCRYAEGATSIKITQARSNGKKACSVCKPNSDKDQKRCAAKTADGTQCKRMTANASGKCFQHDEKH